LYALYQYLLYPNTQWLSSNESWHMWVVSQPAASKAPGGPDANLLDLTEGYVYYAGNTSMIVTAITAGFVMYKTRCGSGVFRFRFLDLTNPHRLNLRL
jgi:hypothetical protein